MRKNRKAKRQSATDGAKREDDRPGSAKRGGQEEGAPSAGAQEQKARQPGKFVNLGGFDEFGAKMMIAKYDGPWHDGSRHVHAGHDGPNGY
jgi:hypothetical protein